MNKLQRWVRTFMGCVTAVVGNGCVDLFGAGGSGSQGNDSGADRLVQAGCIAFEALPEGGIWALSSDPDKGGDANILISGYGLTVQSVSIHTGLTTCATFGIEENVTTGGLEVDGRQIRISATLSGSDQNGLPDGEGPCSVELTGTVSSCGNATSLSLVPVYASEIFSVDAQGTATVEGREYSIGALDLTFLRRPKRIPCEEPLDSLEGMSWNISPRDPFVFANPVEPDSIEFNAGGLGAVVDGASVFGSLTPDDPAAPFFSCFGIITTGTVSFDGVEFRMHAETEPTVDGGACVVDIEGRVSGCDNAPPGFSDTVSQVFYVDGAATFSQGELQAERSPLFLVLSKISPPPEDGNGGDGFIPPEAPPEVGDGGGQ